ncbi:MAG TPA: ABC transporter permease [Vicinamibacterales bacterium]|nr:ABC transporter permease [Vicinamibacterales bacterium]
MTVEAAMERRVAPSVAPAVTLTAPPYRADSGILRALRLTVRRSVALRAGFAIVVAVLLVALAAPVIAPHDPVANNLAQRLRAPSPQHVFGTDDFGRDVFSRVVWGTRISLLVAAIVVTIAALGGALVGLVAGYLGGRLDDVVMRVVDILLAFPAILLALAVMAALGSSLINVIIAVAIAFFPRFARLQRAVVLTVREREFVTAAEALGSSRWRILWRHVMPNCLAPVIVMSTVSAADAILVEASLSFLGLGVQPPAPTWGAVISDGRSFLQNAPWISGLSGLAIMVTVLGLNLLGDGARDVLDPTLRGQGSDGPTGAR